MKTTFSWPKAVIFDLDGTLIEYPYEYVFNETERVLHKLEMPALGRETFQERFSNFDFFGFIEEPNRVEFQKRFWLEFNETTLPKAVILEGTKELLQSLKAKDITLAVATARPTNPDRLREDLSHIELLNQFEVISTSSHDHTNWGDKETQIREVCEQLKVLPTETMMVGDVPLDIQSAKKAGVGLTVAVLSGGIKQEVLDRANPDLIVSDLGELNRQLPLLFDR